LRAAAESDLGLASQLEALSRPRLMSRRGAAGRVRPSVARAVRRRLTPAEATSRCQCAATLVLTAFPRASWNSSADAGELRRAGQLVTHAARLAEDPALNDPVMSVLLLDGVGWYLVHSGEAAEAIAVLERAQKLRDAVFPPDDRESREAHDRLVALLQSTGQHTAAAALLERRLTATAEAALKERSSRMFADAEQLHAAREWRGLLR